MGTGKLNKIGLPASPKIVKALQELTSFDLGDGKPDVTGYYDARGTVRRMVARYPEGWQVRVNFDSQGLITSHSASLKLQMVVRG